MGIKKPDKAFEPYPAYRKVTPSNISAVHLGIALLQSSHFLVAFSHTNYYTL